MIGFACGIALIGLAGIAWPLYLHFRQRQRPRVQVIPSLRIFGAKIRRRKQRRFENLLLLISRVAVLCALFLWVSQPFLETERELPLARLEPADHTLLRHLVVVVDDGITAWHGRTLGARLDRAKEAVRTTLESLPEDVRVAVVTTTFPQATDFLDRQQAVELIEGFSVIPKEGDGGAALIAAAERLRDRRGAVLIAAPRDGDLWRASPEGTATGFDSVHFHDLTDLRLSAFIEDVTEDGDGLMVTIVGDADDITGITIAAHGLAGGSSRREISVQEALRGRLRLAAGELGTGAGTVVELAGARHPWGRAYSRRSDDAARGGGIVVLLQRRDADILAGEIVQAALTSLRPRLKRHFLFADAIAAENLPRASAVVVVGAPELTLVARRWLRQHVGDGVPVLALPSGDPASARRRPADELLPSWEPEIRLDEHSVVPLALDTASTPESHRFDDFLVAQIDGLAFDTLHEPRFSGTSRSVLETASGRTVIALHRPQPDSKIWALGVPFDVTDGSVVFHPVFPLLLQWLLFPREGADVASTNLRTGTTVRVADGFGPGHGDARMLHLVDGAETPVETPRGWLAIDEPGFYELRSESSSETRAANHPRPLSHTILSREEWRRSFASRGVAWLDDTALSHDSLAHSAIVSASNESVRYDMTTVLALLLLSALVLEAASLAHCWRRRESDEGSR